MGIIETKFSKGDTIYAFGSTYAKKNMVCPDCLGSLKWSITFADGHSEECPCFTCSRGYEGPYGKIHYSQWVPSVEKYEVQEVRFGSQGAEYLVEYWYSTDDGMSHHSNRIFRDAEIFDNEAEATVAAQAEYEKRMAYLADNNFPKKGDFAKALERSTFGYSRYAAIEETEKMKQWLDLLRPLKVKSKHTPQFDGDHKEKKQKQSAA